MPAGLAKQATSRELFNYFWTVTLCLSFMCLCTCQQYLSLPSHTLFRCVVITLRLVSWDQEPSSAVPPSTCLWSSGYVCGRFPTARAARSNTSGCSSSLPSGASLPTSGSTSFCLSWRRVLWRWDRFWKEERKTCNVDYFLVNLVPNEPSYIKVGKMITPEVMQIRWEIMALVFAWGVFCVVRNNKYYIK